ncbi:hypothetical protein CRI93_09490 [Longimonas halophila]|uniref:Polysaccharide pyruvyl transferase domain-containing protein n=1 Tax=Longimonas halophila TaxID=1469170 RepID=A0A2H3P687_9BACT|nr:polysaccharide pyruvyl transferase family protein [Longimonas halophila]PEN06505.1 hypothetical protein CRI93_09490 [Longimonas halophila]
MNYYLRKVPIVFDLLCQHIDTPEVAIIGSVHRENVGDMALSEGVASVLEKEDVSSGTQLIGEGMVGLSKWPIGQGKAIVAGGALGRETPLRSLVEKYGNDPHQVAIVGISFWSNHGLSKASVDFLRSVKFLSCRNYRDVDTLTEMGIKGAKFAYDNAFALPVKEYVRDKRRLGVNVVSRHMAWDGHGYIPANNKEVERPFGPAYTRSLQNIASTHLERGWDVVHIPFTNEDERFASWVFKDIPVELHTYDPRVEPTYRAVAKCSRFIGTRYHAHIFALKAQVPLLSFSYASKCTLLKQNLGIPDSMQATHLEVSQNGDNVVRRFLNETGFVLPDDQLTRIESSVRNNIRTALHAIS